MAQLDSRGDDDATGSGAIAAVEVGRDEAGVPVVRVSGELDIANVATLRAAVEPIVSQSDERLIVDLEGLTFMDSSALAVFLAWNANLCPVEIRRPAPMVRRLIEIMGLTETLRLDS